MRGKAVVCPCFLIAKGITPAYAGKRCGDACWCSNLWDHPRVCGEKGAWNQMDARRSGSPPRMRGKGEQMDFNESMNRITPAYAGKSAAASIIEIKVSGSPPRMRGKESNERRERQAHGITPAYAGKRLKRSRSTVPPVAIVPLFPSVCNKPVVSDGSPAGRDAPLFLPAENAVPASPAYNLRSL